MVLLTRVGSKHGICGANGAKLRGTERRVKVEGEREWTREGEGEGGDRKGEIMGGEGEEQREQRGGEQ